MRIRDACLIGSWSGTRIELFPVFVRLSALLKQPILLTQHVNDEAGLLAHSIAPVNTVLIVAEVAERRDLVHVAFELDHGRR